MKIDRNDIAALVQAEILGMIEETDSAWLHHIIVHSAAAHSIWQDACRHFERPDVRLFIDAVNAEDAWKALLDKDL